jgi:hypothetical protein
VGRGDNHGQRVPADRLGPQAGGQVRSLHEADVGGAGQDGRGHVGGVFGGQGDGRAGIDGSQRGQPGREQVFGDRHAGRDPQPRVVLPAQSGDPRVEGRGRVDRGLGPAGNQRAIRGQVRPARRTLDQGQAQVPFELAHPGAGRGLGNAVLGRRPAQAAQACDAEQKVVGGQIHHAPRERHKHRL